MLNYKEYTVNSKSMIVGLIEKVESKEAYFLGYILGDGGYHHPVANQRLARMAVSSTEPYIIDTFCEQFQPLSSPKLREPNSNLTKGIIGRKKYKSLVFSTKLTPMFEKYGLLSKKDTRTFHNIPKSEMNSFLLGLFDADGTLGFGQRKDRNRLWTSFKITHPNLNMLKKLQTFLTLNLDIASGIHPKGTEACFVLHVSKIDSVIKLMDYIYSSKVDYSIRYKRQKYVDLKML